MSSAIHLRLIKMQSSHHIRFHLAGPFTESRLQTPNRSSKNAKSLHPRVTPVSAARAPYIQSTSEDSDDDIVRKPRYSLRNFSTKLKHHRKTKASDRRMMLYIIINGQNAPLRLSMSLKALFAHKKQWK